MGEMIQEKTTNNGRLYILDVIRSVAIFLVVLNHGIEITYGFYPDAMNVLPLGEKIYAFSGFMLGRLGVPLFLMLSGFLLLPRKYDHQGILRFYKKNLLPLLLTWEIWVLLYAIYLGLRNGTGFDVGQYLKSAFFLGEIDLSHTWYVPTIIGIYLFLPFVAIALQKVNWKIVLCISAVVFVYVFVVPKLGILQGTIFENISYTVLNLNYSGGFCSLYLVSGYYAAVKSDRIRMFFRKKGRIFAAILAFAALFAVMVALLVIVFQKGIMFHAFYDFPLVLIMGILVFVLFLQIPGKGRGSKAFMEISKASFGIYLIHLLILLPLFDLLRPKMGLIPLSLLATIISFVASFAVVELVSLIPKAGKILFLRK